MALQMLAVDKDIEFSLREQAVWLNHGISTLRVDTMQEAIEKLLKDSFYLIAINGDNVNYLPLLKIMSDMSSVHIFIMLSDFNIEKQNEALLNGATGCAEFQANPEDNVKSVLAYLHSINARSKPKLMPRIVVCGNLTIIHEHHQVFYNDKEIVFTLKEYDVLYYMLSNPNITLTFKNIVLRIWGNEVVSNNAVWQVIIRLRKKLNESGFNDGNIINIRGVGYRFLHHPGK